MSDNEDGINEIQENPDIITNEEIINEDTTDKKPKLNEILKTKQKKPQSQARLKTLEKARVHREINNKQKNKNNEKIKRLKEEYDIDIDILLRQLEEKKYHKKEEPKKEVVEDEYEEEEYDEFDEPPRKFNQVINPVKKKRVSFFNF